MPNPRSPLAPSSPRLPNSPSLLPILSPKEPPVKSDERDLPWVSPKLESDLLLAKSQIEVNGAIDEQTVLKFMTDYNIKPVDLAQLWCVVSISLISLPVPTIPIL